MNTFNFVLSESQCTNNCVFCGSRPFGDLARNVASEKRKLIAIRDAGEAIEAVEISGNDPVEYLELASIVKWLKEEIPGCRVTLSSHARDLRDPARLAPLLAEGLDGVTVPVYGHCAEVHEAVTRAPESFNQTLQGIAGAALAGLEVKITTLITSQNAPHVEALFAFLAELAGSFSVSVPLFFIGTKAPHAPDMNALAPALERAVAACSTDEKGVAWLRNIPRCVAPAGYTAFEHSSPPRAGYRHMQEAGRVSLAVVGTETVPDYQVRRKDAACATCAHEGECEGFYESYRRAGLFESRPVRTAPAARAAL